MTTKGLIHFVRICFIFGVSLMISGCMPGRTSTVSPNELLPTASRIPASPSAQPALPSASPTLTSGPTLMQPPASPTSSPTPLTAQSVVLSGFSGPVMKLAWSPDGALLASSSGGFQTTDFEVRIWKRDGSLITDLGGHTQPITDLAWSPDGKTLASSSLDGSVRLWNRDGSLRQTLHGDAGHVFALAWSPDGQTLASGSIVTYTNPTVQWWNPAGQIIKTLTTAFSGGKFYNLAWSPDGKSLLGGATDYKLWRADGEQVFWLKRCEHCTPSWAMAWGPDSQLWAIGDESGYVEIYSLIGKKIAKMQDGGGVNSLAWSPDGRRLVGISTIFSPEGKYLYTLRDQSRYVNSNAWSPNGKMLASGGSDMRVHLWRTDGTPLAALQGHSGSVNVVAWSPDGKILASGSDDKTVRLWNIK